MSKEADGRSEGEVILSNDSIVSISGLNKKGLLLYSTSERKKGFADLHLFPLTKQGKQYAFHSRKGVAESLAKFIKYDWIAFTSDQTGRSEVFISDLTKPDVRTQFSFEGGEEPRYDSVNQILYYREVNKLMGASLSFGDNRSFKIGPAKAIFEDEDWINVPGYSWDMSPDGKRFLIIRRTSPKTSNEIKISQHFR